MKQGKDYSPFQAKKIDFEENETMNTITCATQKDNLIIQVKSATTAGFETATEGDSINYSVPNSETRRGRVGNGQAQTIDTAANQAVLLQGNIRRLTEVEVERLQGFRDNHTKYGVYGKQVWINKKEKTFKIIEGVQEVSRTQRYKMCGNAVTCDVVEMIGKKLLQTIFS